MSPLKSLSRNTLTLLLSNTGSAVLSFALSVIIGRALGTGGLGGYAAALAWIFPLSLIADFGIGTLITREVVQSPQSETEFLAAATQTRLLLGSSLLLLTWMVAPFLASDTTLVKGIRIAAPLILITPLFGNYTAIFRARQQMWPIPLLNIGMLIVQLILTIAVFALDGGILYALSINTLTSAAQLAGAWWIWHRWFRPPSPSVAHNLNAVRIRQLLMKAWPFALAGILAAVQSRLAPILLERLVDTGSVGYYAAANRFVEACRTIPNAFFGALLPVLTALITQPVALRQSFRKIMLGLAAFSSLLAFGITIAGPTLIDLTYGPNFADAKTTLQLMVWTLVPSLLRAGLTLYWYALGHESLVNRTVAIALILQVLLSLWLIPSYAADGAVLGILGSELLCLGALVIPLIRKPSHVAG